MSDTEMLKVIFEKLEKASFADLELIYRFVTSIIQ